MSETQPAGARPADSEAEDTVDADRLSAIRSMEAQLAATSKTAQPQQHATIAYRLGLAYAEHPTGPLEDSLRRALACYDVAASLFDPRFDPVEHARVVNAAGAAHRSLGNVTQAAELFRQAATLLERHGRPDERAAALNNLGLALAAMGQVGEAVEHFTTAVDLFDKTTPDGMRGWSAALLNRGQARSAAGEEAGLRAALDDYHEALAEVESSEASYHYGLLYHSVGVASMALASLDASATTRLLEEAADSFAESLTVFTRTGFPFQHALAKYNLGYAVERLDGVANQRLALACYEDALAALDPRLHVPQRDLAFASLVRVEARLAEWAPAPGRAHHFASMVAAAAPEDRVALMRDRMLRYLALPGPTRHKALVELAMAEYWLGPERARILIEAELGVLVDLPNEFLQMSLEARLEVLNQLGDEAEEAGRALDDAVGAQLGLPQRLFVRDFLYARGWERP
jgi:tetratricopeptide (TPR) repeat protein